MHDPLVVAFEIHRSWPQRSRMHDAKPGQPRWQIRLRHTCGEWCGTNRAKHEARDPFPWWRLRSYSPFWTLAGKGFYWPALIVVWHVEPDGKDSGEVCPHYRRWQDADGKWQSKILHGWRWHVHHWRIQVPPLRHLRRRLLTRCTWCGGRSRKGDAVNVSHQWDGERGPWWRGERGLFHLDCSSIERAHVACLCDSPVLEQITYGRCARCMGFRRYGATPAELQRQRLLASVSKGQRDATVYACVCELAAAERKAAPDA